MTNITENDTKQANKLSTNDKWLTICNIDDIYKNTGVCADFNGKQVAIFHIKTANVNKNIRLISRVKAVSNFDPFAKANVLSRGLIIEKESEYYVASPLLKQEFCLNTGQCQQDASVTITTYQSRINDGLVQLMET